MRHNCQPFSIAGRRIGLDDPRGNLALEYVRLAERVDAQWLAFENVPGLLSSTRGEDFAAFISAVTGHEYRPPAARWQNAGIAEGRTGRWGIAWRILDAQYFGVAQRRRRVFVIGYRGDWRPAAAVLLEPEGLRGNPPPGRQPGQEAAGTLESRAATGGYDPGAHGAASGHLIAQTLSANGKDAGGASGKLNFEFETFLTYPILEPGARTGISTSDPRAGIGIGEPGDPMFTLQAGKQHGIALSIRGRKGGATAELSGDIMPALRASQGGGDKPHVLLPSAVRRLTPVECERLQGMPGNFSMIPWRGKPADQCPDGPRYRAIGNSMAVPVMNWIFTRINYVHNTLESK